MNSTLFEPLIKKSARFDTTTAFRFELRRWWSDSPARWVAWLMSNPSNADGYRDDPTIKRVIRFAQLWGYDGAIIVNTCPIISSNPAVALKLLAGHGEYGKEQIFQNFEFIYKAGSEAQLRIAAFGANPMIRLSREQLNKFGSPLHCLGTVLSGDPIHPLARGKMRIPDSAMPKLWRSSDDRTG